MGRTTIRIDDELLLEAKRLAAATRRTLTATIEDAVRAALARHGRPRPRRASWTTFRGRGLLPGVELDNTAALLDRMDER